jgi:hypothetical protein
MTTPQSVMRVFCGMCGADLTEGKPCGCRNPQRLEVVGEPTRFEQCVRIFAALVSLRFRGPRGRMRESAARKLAFDARSVN